MTKEVEQILEMLRERIIQHHTVIEDYKESLKQGQSSGAIIIMANTIRRKEMKIKELQTIIKEVENEHRQGS